MKQITYKVFDFDFNTVLKGHLCIVAKKDAKYKIIIDGKQEYQTIAILDDNGNINTDLKGAGICIYKHESSKFIITIDGESFYFSDKGILYDEDDTEWQLHPADIIIDVPELSKESTRSIKADNIEIENIDANITLKDQIAIETLEAILSKIDKNLSELGENEMLYYCLQSYKWATKMIEARKITE